MPADHPPSSDAALIDVALSVYRDACLGRDVRGPDTEEGRRGGALLAERAEALRQRLKPGGASQGSRPAPVGGNGRHRHHVVDVDALDARGTIRLHVEDDTCAELAVDVEYYPAEEELRAEGNAALYLTADELGQLAAAAEAVRAELVGTRPAAPAAEDAFAECFDVETHVGFVAWTIGVGPDHSKTGERPRYVRLELDGGELVVDLRASDAAWLAGALAERAGELASALDDPAGRTRPAGDVLDELDGGS
jgi:hypothetical protein